MSGEWRLVLYRGAYCAYRREAGNPIRRALGATNREHAEAELARFVAAEARVTGGQLQTVGQAFDAYIQSRPAEGYARQRALWIKAAIQKVVRPDLLALPLEAMDRSACRDFAQARYRQGAKPGTVATNLGILRAALNWAAGERLIDKEPPMELPPSAPPKDRWLSAEEARALMDGAEAPHIRLFIILALHTAARAASLLDLTWDRVNDRFIDLNPPGRARTRKGRAVVPMNPVLAEALIEARRGALSDHVIEWAGGPVLSIKKAFRRAAERAGLPGVTPHTLRHTAATWMVQAGVPIAKVAGYLGHRDSRTTERVYGHHAPDYLQEGSAAIIERLHGPSMLFSPGSFEPVGGEQKSKTRQKRQSGAQKKR
ncbi:tyrosine-type recombinase/integrase [Ferrovibrio sp.]|uniref:tyrosine-type recombinase/integrase n=1 Tax=Ferrovibrio sp. TaxID=1917215 RepID=UPI0035AE39FE